MPGEELRRGAHTWPSIRRLETTNGLASGPQNPYDGDKGPIKVKAMRKEIRDTK